MSYRVRGMQRPFLTARRVIVAQDRRPAGGSAATSRAREPLPWEVAAFKATRAPHVVLLTPPRRRRRPLRAGLERAYREIRRDLPARDLPRSVLVIAARDAAQAEQLDGPDRAAASSRSRTSRSSSARRRRSRSSACSPSG